MTWLDLLQRREGIKSGRPCLVGTGILVEGIAHRFAAGDSIAELAVDYVVSMEAIEAAIRLVLLARGTNLDEQRAARKVDRLLPLADICQRCGKTFLQHYGDSRCYQDEDVQFIPGMARKVDAVLKVTP